MVDGRPRARPGQPVRPLLRHRLACSRPRGKGPPPCARGAVRRGTGARRADPGPGGRRAVGPLRGAPVPHRPRDLPPGAGRAPRDLPGRARTDRGRPTPGATGRALEGDPAPVPSRPPRARAAVAGGGRAEAGPGGAPRAQRRGPRVRERERPGLGGLGALGGGGGPARRADRPAGLPAVLVAGGAGGGRLPAVLRHHGPRGAPGPGPRGLPGHPRPGPGSGAQGPRHRAPRRPCRRPGRSPGLPRASPGAPRRRAPRRSGGVRGRGEDPGPRRAAPPILAGGRDHRLRGDERPERPVRRPSWVRAAGAFRAALHGKADRLRGARPRAEAQGHGPALRRRGGLAGLPPAALGSRGPAGPRPHPQRADPGAGRGDRGDARLPDLHPLAAGRPGGPRRRAAGAG